MGNLGEMTIPHLLSFIFSLLPNPPPPSSLFISRNILRQIFFLSFSIAASRFLAGTDVIGVKRR